MINRRVGIRDDATPSFAISLYKEYRGQGIGTQLMVKMLQMLIDLQRYECFVIVESGK